MLTAIPVQIEGLQGIEFSYDPDVLTQNVESRKKRSTCVLVLGIARSGTSMLSGILHHLGVDMGILLPDADERNPLGYFEDALLSNFHCQVIGTRGMDYLFSHSRNFEITEDQRELYNSVIVFNEYRSMLWGVKDPRILHLIPEFVALGHSDIIAIRIKRNLKAVEKSLMRHSILENYDNLGLSEIVAGWEGLRDKGAEYLESRGAQILDVTYEGILADPETAIWEISEFVGLPFKYKAVEFIRPELNRSGVDLCRI